MDRRLLKTLSCILSVFLITALTAGCSGGGGNGQPESTATIESNSPTSQTIDGSSGSAAPSGSVTITYGAHVANMEAQEPATWDVMQKFMETNPDIKLEITGADTDEHVKRMKLAAQSGTLPDVFWMLPAPAAEMWDAGLLLDFSDMLNQYPDLDKRMGESVRKTSPVQGVVYGFPYQKLVTGLWYNKALFKQYNISEPTQGTTYEEFTEMVKTFNQNGVVTISKGAKDPFSCWAFLTAFARYGYFDKIDAIKSGGDSFVNDDFRRYFEKLDELRQLGAFPSNIATMDYFQAGDMFVNSKSAMFDAGVWDATKVNDALGEDVGFWWGPTFPDGVGNQQISMQAYTNTIRASANVADDPAKKEAVYRFLDYFYSAEADQIRIDCGAVPLANNGDTSKAIPAFRAVLEAMATPDWPSVEDQADLVVTEPVQVAMHDAIYGVMCGTYTPDKAMSILEEAQARER